MDNLDVAAHLISFIVPGDKNHLSVLDENIPMAAFTSIAISDAQNLWRSCWLAAYKFMLTPKFSVNSSQLTYNIHQQQ
jgi:hypothetical protein